MSHNLFPLAKQLGQLCIERNIKIALAESCTGGFLSQLITDIAGSSQWFNGSVIVYSNAAKTALLDVDAAMIKQYGAVSEHVAKALAINVRQKLAADIAVSITGIAGPGGGTKEKPVGTVCFGLATTTHCETKTQHFTSGRGYIRKSAAEFALQWLMMNQ